MSDQILQENLENQDLKRLVHPQLHIDEYKSKMGQDDEICVLSFLVTGKEPSMDLVGFLEKGFPWILDADVSSGEKENGKYLVFVEAERRQSLPENIILMMEDLINLTGQTLEEWNIKYHKSKHTYPLTLEELKRLIPASPKEYRESVDDTPDNELDQLKTAAGITVDTKAPVNDFTESIRIAAGIK